MNESTFDATKKSLKTSATPKALTVGFAELNSGRSRLSAAEVVEAVLAQFALSTLLNEGEVPAPLGPIGHSPTTRLMIPGYVPRRRDSLDERVHHARVGVRRLRSTIRTFGPLIDPQWSMPMAAELSWYGDVLGVTRDLSVLREALLDEELPMRSWEVHLLLSDELDRAFNGALAHQRSAQGTERYARLLDELRHLEERISFAPEAYRSARKVLGPQLEPTWREFSEASKAAHRDPTYRNLHVLRIRAKRLQQACETVALVEGDRAFQCAKAAERLQRRLGLVHDSAVAEEWLNSLADRTPKWQMHLRELAEYERIEAKRRRRGWREDWLKVQARWRRWH